MSEKLCSLKKYGGGSGEIAELLAMGEQTAVSSAVTIDMSAFSGDITVLMSGRVSQAIWWGNLDSKTATKKYYYPSTDTSTCTISNAKVVTTKNMIGSTSQYQHGIFILKGHLEIPS